MSSLSTYHSFTLALLLLAISCGGLTEEEINTQAKIRFDRRVEHLKAEKIKECKQEIDRKAEIIVDSLIQEMSLNPLQEDLYKPPIPDRPKFVEVDSSVFNSKHSVKPIPK